MTKNNKSKKMKRNKGFPYKSHTKGGNLNPPNKYKVVDDEMNIIKSFRMKASALKFIQSEGKLMNLHWIESVTTQIE